ncbi:MULTISPECIES: ABC transporter permease [Paraburkholderia]|uniref:ABC transporter permease n=1 Tax=Paraburkholderia TaxID=1822464 RepID=UPI0018F647F2|nr:MULTISPECIES: ABC transporter permease [Paraburkholderia]WEY42095.1 ABC transporter permease [Paraburkholderia sp. SUR17]
MLAIAWRMLIGDRAKYFGIVFSLAFTTLLITQQAATLVAVLRSTTTFVDQIQGVDMWVTDLHSDYVDDVKAMDDIAVYRMRSVSGVAWAVPLYKGSISARLPDGRAESVQLIGVDDSTLIGAPGRMVSGSLADLRMADSVFVDEDGARNRLAYSASGATSSGARRPLRVGDTFELNDHRVVVAGIYRGEKTFASTPVVYTTYERVKTYVPSQRKLLSYVLVKLRPDADVARVKSQTREGLKLLARTSREFSNETLRWFILNTSVILNMGLSALMTFAIGGGIAGMTFYNFMLDSQRHFAVLRAIGAQDGTLIGMVALQALGVTLLGYGLGIGGIATFILLNVNSDINVRLTWPVVGAACAVVVLVGSTAGSLGLRRVLRLDPGVVFK